MKATLALLMTLATVSIAHAAPKAQPTTQFTCTFTEPFLTMTIDLNKRTVTLKDDVMKKGELIASHITIRKDVKDPFVPSFTILSKDKKPVATITATMGSDGMSDAVYPYSISYQQWVGGCESNVAKRVDPQN